MSKFEEIVMNYGMKKCCSCSKFSPAGKCLSIDTDVFNGIYWYYETENFVIDIHDFFVKKDVVIDQSPEIFQMDFFIQFFSSFIIIANGEWFEPYQNMSSNNVFIMDLKNSSGRYLLHGNYPFFSVSVKFKKKMFEDGPENLLKIHDTNLSNIFIDTKDKLSKDLAKISYDILNCTLDKPSADSFFEIKANEWLECTLNAYENIKTKRELTLDDEKAIHTVEHYINDHYSLEITQELLEKISMLSGTNLKTKFKQKHHMSITEYIQRKRINVAENLLATTELDIKDIANSVGYSSSSRFATLFKRYKGIKPNEIRKFKTSINKNPCVCTKVEDLSLDD